MIASDDLNDGLFHVLFVTTPARLATPRFGAYFAQPPHSELSLDFVLKRREPAQVKDEAGRVSMGWTSRCSDEQFEAGAASLSAQRPGRAWINIETEVSESDKRALLAHPGLGALLSGHDMSAEQAREALGLLADGRPLILALENEAMMLAGADLLERFELSGLVIGTSYLSESSRVYDQMGLDKYRSLMRGLAKRAAGRGARPYTTSNYCTFEATGLGDKNKSFVSEQVDFVSKYGSWGSLTRFYSHLDVAQNARLAQGGRAAQQKEKP